MSRSNAARRLAALFRLNQASRPVIFLGAGASFRCGVPLAEDAVKRIARDAYAREILGTSDSSRVRPSDWMPFLQGQSWFIDGPDRLGENFPAAVESLLTPRAYRRDFLMREMRAQAGLSPGYKSLARMAQRGLWKTALTTNFDGCIADALRELSPNLHRFSEVNRSPGDFDQFTIYGLQIVYLHGTVEAYSDRNTSSEVKALDRRLIFELRPIIYDSPLIVVGYRGGEPSIMDGFLLELAQDLKAFRNGIYWCSLKGEELHDKVKVLAERVGTNFFDLRIDGFDQLFEELDHLLATEDAYRRFHTSVTGGPLYADERLLEGLTLDDLDGDLMLATLTRYCERLRRPPVTRETMIGLLREQALVGEINGRLQPSLGCFLLFGKNVQDRFPQACVSVTFGGRRRQIIRGNLVQQFHQLSERVRAADVNPILRIKTGRSSEERAAYHDRSLTEMVVNLLAHRDYEVADYSAIDVIPGRSIEFSNPGGLPNALLERIALDEEGHFEPVRSLTEMRNPCIADVFFGIGSMDERGSGLCDAALLMRENGGDASFGVTRDNLAFRAILLQPRQNAPASSNTAITLTPFGTYITNHLRFLVIPEEMTIVPMPLQERASESSSPRLFMPDAQDAMDAIFIRQRERIISFAPPKLLPRGVESPAIVKIIEFLTQPGGRSAFVWLMREHFVRYLRRFDDLGLTIEPGGHRAYFRLMAEDRTTIRYDAVRRRGVDRDVVKQRTSGREIWHENEGITFDVVLFDGVWAMQIKPFYMFTRANGLTPLPTFKRTRLATSRMKFDRNQAVNSDLGFWSRFLSPGAAAISLGYPGLYDLILDGAFHEVEVYEHGLEDRPDGRANRNPA